MNTEKLSILPVSQWPAGSVPDGKLYSLETSKAMRPLRAENDTSPDDFDLDFEGALQWVPVMHGKAIFDAPVAEIEFSGTYAEVSEKAAALNAEQKRLFGGIPWIYCASPIEEAMAA